MGPARARFFACVSHQDRSLFDKTRERFGRAQRAPEGGEDRPEPIRINPVGRANLFKWLRGFRFQADRRGAHLVPMRCPFL
jgi:hypothetical protein